MTRVSKGAEDPNGFCRRGFAFASARSAFRAYMQALRLTQDHDVLLPAYIGWSANEGSGVFDPVQDLGVRYSFYRMSPRLHVDADDVIRKIRARPPHLLVLIHYFGFPDPNANELCTFAQENGVPVLEDEAHAMLSDLVGGICGRQGNAAIYSLHKMLPLANGGRLVLNRPPDPVAGLLMANTNGSGPPWNDYDLFRIAARRRQNAAFLLQALRASALPLEPLHTSLPGGVVPQSLPVLVGNGSRDRLHSVMDAAGYGLVSLYHSLISAISAEDFPESYALSRSIINLPVHQDTNEEALAALIQCLGERLHLCDENYSRTTHNI